MLEHYFTRPSTVDRLRSLWLGPALSRYAEWLSDRQISCASALFKIQTLVLFDRFLTDRHVRTLEELPTQIEPFVKKWRRTRGRRPHTASYARSLRAGPRTAIEELLRLLLPDFVGTVRRQPWPLQDLAPGFREHLSDERGLRPETLHGYEHHMRVFERFLRSAKITDLSTLTPKIVNRFLIESTAGQQPGGRQARAGALRVLLRYLRRQEIIATDLSRAVPRGRTYKQAAIPRSIPWSDIERILASVDRRSACGKRDYAVLMLFATYGLRAQEVAALELSAIDWPLSRFHVLSRKAGNSTTYPLAAPVGEAIIDYLRNARPQCTDRHLFISLTAPFRGVGHWAMSTRASVYLRRAGIKVRRPGSHTFRHSCVQRLVEADMPFKQIGDYVGHRSDAATQIYAKVAIHKLRALTLGDAEDVL
ncbi:MAG TPA: tyrosine-type recombinase/integrase [Steroidobacteraceae bacterium]|nr:tyrosine-type recombinase/integrase [Steroidobacteraceae bacterium]